MFVKIKIIRYAVSIFISYIIATFQCEVKKKNLILDIYLSLSYNMSMKKKWKSYEERLAFVKKHYKDTKNYLTYEQAKDMYKRCMEWAKLTDKDFFYWKRNLIPENKYNVHIECYKKHERFSNATHEAYIQERYKINLPSHVANFMKEAPHNASNLVQSNTGYKNLLLDI